MGETPLHFAAGNAAVVEMLLKAGASADKKDWVRGGLG